MNRSHHNPDGQAVVISGWIYRHLLVGYPQAYRHEYGPLMDQLFRDQCRDAWRCGRWWGLMLLWLRVLPDFMKTSVLEHLSTFKGRKNMIQRISAFLPSRTPRRVFVGAFAAVFLLVVASSTLITFVLPSVYSSTARIKVAQGAGEANHLSNQLVGSGNYDPYYTQTQCELIKSDMILGKVVNDLDLSRVWSKKYGSSTTLTPSETIALLKKQIDLRPVPDTSLIEIRILSDKPSESANLANAIARTYQEHDAQQHQADIIDFAMPGLRPVRPNKPLNITVGILGGALLALVAGAGFAGITSWLGRRSGLTMASSPNQ